MRLLDRYLLRELLVPLGYCLGGFLIIFDAFDLIGKLRKFQEDGMTARDCLDFYLVSTPETFVTFAPMALLLALLWAVSNHARQNEFTAIRSAGISLWRLSLPYLVVGGVLSAIVFVVNEYWAPGTPDRLEQIHLRHKPGAPSRFTQNLYFCNEAEGRAWFVRYYNAATGEMGQPHVTWTLPGGAYRDIHAFKNAVPTNGGWVFHDVEMFSYKSPQDIFPEYTKTASLFFRFSETTELIHSEIQVNRVDLRPQTVNRAQLAISEIYNYLQLHPKAEHGRRAMLMTQLQGRIAAPLTSFTVALIAIPFGARSGRRNVFVGVASSIVIAFAYIMFQSVCLALGNGGLVPPVVAAWLPNVLFGATGAILIARAR